jgi:glycosyltransferase involved in cell wall biosynthesis
VTHKTFVSVVVYTRHEAEAAAEFVAAFGPWLAARFSLYEIVLVDDASDTLGPALAAAERHGVNIVGIQLARRHGVEAGIKAGLDRAMGDWVFELETAGVDFTPDLLDDMYAAAGGGFDVVTASGDDGSWRSRLFYRFVNRYADLDTPLRTERVRLTSRRTLGAMLAMREKVRYRKALYAVLGHRRSHLRYLPTQTAAARRMDRETSSLAFDILLSFSGFGLRLAHRLSLIFGVLSVAAVGYAVFVFAFRSAVEGWTTLTVLISGGFTGLFLILGVLGEYLARILVEVRGRPHYSIRTTAVHTPADTAVPAQAPPAFLARELAGDPVRPLPEPRPAVGTQR